MPTEVMNIIFSALGIIITGLATWGTTVIVNWLNSNIKNKKLAALSETILIIVSNAVKATYQTYVESIKGTDMWTEEAQKKALQDALTMAKNSLTVEALKFIEERHGDIDTYIINLIHSILYDLKNNPEKEEKEIRVKNQAA